MRGYGPRLPEFISGVVSRRIWEVKFIIAAGQRESDSKRQPRLTDEILMISKRYTVIATAVILLISSGSFLSLLNAVQAVISDEKSNSTPPVKAKKSGGNTVNQADNDKAGKAAESAPANRLARESSPYLLMHAHNPVDWYPWGPAAFEKARAEHKPVFLSVGYSSCYWCHVMERQVF